VIPLQEYYTLEELRNNFRREISTTSREEPQKVNAFSSVLLSAFGQQGNIFSMCGYISEFLSPFLKVIVTTNLFLASITDC
jgi:hypothetical protein